MSSDVIYLAKKIIKERQAAIALNEPCLKRDVARTSECSLEKADQVSQWQAQLALFFQYTKRGSVLKLSQHKGPLYIQKAFYPQGKDLAHLYILHPPGGLVSGDSLQINVSLDKKAQVLLTTPGAGRVYRAREDKALQEQQVTLKAAQGATLEWLPLETILYPKANTRLNTLVKLDQGASFIGWDICCIGLPANGQVFESGSLEQCLQIEIEDKVRLRERVQLNDDNRHLYSETIGFAARSVNGLMVAGPFITSTDNSDSPDNLDNLIERLREHGADTAQIIADSDESTSDQTVLPPLCSVSNNSEFILIRYLGQDSEQARDFFIQCWQEIRPLLLGVPACAPRIWAT